jgi:protein gp37
MLPADWGDGYRNVWLGVTAENQTYFDSGWGILQRIPAVVRFISYEPALGPLRLPKQALYQTGLYQAAKVAVEHVR